VIAYSFKELGHSYKKITYSAIFSISGGHRMEKTQEITIKSSIDGSRESCLFANAGRSGSTPIVVALHTWSTDRYNQVEHILPFIKERRWNALFPEFRGPNLIENPRAHEACGSQLAMQDVLDAIDQICAQSCFTDSPLFLVGGSGGGHMALMMAAYSPDLWDLVFASCSITNLAQWHQENTAYTPHIEACCGGAPDSPEQLQEYKKRSPAEYAEKIAQAHVYIAHGKEDASVPFSHSLDLYNQIYSINKESQVYLEIFQGGHELRLDDAFALFDRQIEKKLSGESLSG
jgi:predicted esterase